MINEEQYLEGFSGISPLWFSLFFIIVTQVFFFKKEYFWVFNIIFRHRKVKNYQQKDDLKTSKSRVEIVCNKIKSCVYTILAIFLLIIEFVLIFVAINHQIELNMMTPS